MDALAAYRAFHEAHTAHGPLVFGADEPTVTGYHVWAACPYGAEWTRWVSLQEVARDLDPRDLRWVLHR
jgi:hypothetical protein